MFFADSLKRRGILGINERNAHYMLVHNSRRLYPFVDDKLKTKEFLAKHGIPTPPIYFSLSGNHHLRRLGQIATLSDFVIKPAKGSAGRGILVITGRQQEQWVRSSGAVLSFADIQFHIQNILIGLFSLGGVNDRAFIEYRVVAHEIFSSITFQGTPDIRIILYRGIPVMAMLRLPTKKSDGKANLHQGAVGTGIDLARGRTLAGVYNNRRVEAHPDTRRPISGLNIPDWDRMVEIAIKTYDVFQLGYFGIDFVIDQQKGPLVLELNARPGLSIQIANNAGLRPRLLKVDSRLGQYNRKCPDQRSAIFREMVSTFMPERHDR